LANEDEATETGSAGMSLNESLHAGYADLRRLFGHASLCMANRYFLGTLEFAMHKPSLNEKASQQTVNSIERTLNARGFTALSR